MAAVSTMHTVLLCAPAHSGLLQPALQAALRLLLDPDAEADCNELVLASLAGVIGRAVVSAPALFAAAAAASSALVPQPTMLSYSLVSRMLELGDSIVLSLQRKISALAFGSLLSQDATLLPLVGEM